jgi:signal transduction histidine kinase
MNNPLASILGLSKNIQSIDFKHWERTKHMASLIHTEAFSLDFQLKNIFAAAELESGEQVLEVTQVDISALLKSVVDMYSHQAKAKQITIQLQGFITECKNTYFKTDPAKLQLIVSNLIANAIEYSYPKSNIILTGRRPQETLTICVKDFGIGINKAEQDIIFNRFTQLDRGITKSHKGHGLGLSVTKALLEILNGQIQVHSVMGKGSTFTVFIPESDIAVDNVATDGNELFFNEGELF